jgi:hypothetical protein
LRAHNLSWTADTGWTPVANTATKPGFVLFFGERNSLESGERFFELKAMHPKAIVLGCSTGGQIIADEVTDDTITALAIEFDKTAIRLAADMDASGDSFSRGQRLGRQLSHPDLKHIFILADGTYNNGSELVRGLTEAVGPLPTITGGLAGDGPRFERTLVCADAPPTSSCVAVVGFYGDALVIGHSSRGGWDEFGPKRSVTRSKGNIVFELDGEPILDLYKRYLGSEANGLPGTGLLYPLSIFDPASPSHRVVRTILGINEMDNSMTFAGDVPQGFSAQLMQGRFDRLADAAGEATRRAFAKHVDLDCDMAAIFVSCVGRRILMGQNIIDEAIAAQSATLPRSRSIGFYSYGEICPHDVSGLCGLHNQSMTVTTLSERG